MEEQLQISQAQDLIITIVGWIYFSAWSISFYGQIYINFKLKKYSCGYAAWRG